MTKFFTFFVQNEKSLNFIIEIPNKNHFPYVSKPFKFFSFSPFSAWAAWRFARSPNQLPLPV